MSLGGEVGLRIVENAFRLACSRRIEDCEIPMTFDHDLKATVRTIPDYPKQGILFRDITTLLGGCARLPPRGRRTGAALGRHRRSTRSPASRRAASSSAARWRIRSPPASCRSARKASCRTPPCGSPIRWNTASTRWRCTPTPCSPASASSWSTISIATGGTAEGAVKLLRQIGANVVAACFIIDLPDLGGADKLRAMDVPVRTLMAFDGH